MSDIKVIRLEDLTAGGKETSKGGGLRVQLKYSSYSTHNEVKNLGSPNKPGTTPLDDVCQSLFEIYRNSPSCPGQASAELPAAEYTALLRAIMMQWAASPSASETLRKRVARASAMAAALVMDQDIHEHLLHRAMEANNSVVGELKLQASAIRSGSFTGIAEADFLQQEALQAWKDLALSEAEALVHQLQGLPDFNGLLEVSVVGGESIQMKQKGMFFSKTLIPSPYISVNFHDPSFKNTQRFTSAVAKNTDTPAWSLELPSSTISSEAAELSFKVKHCHGSKPSSIDKVLGRTGLRLRGLPSGLSQRVTLNLYVSAAAGGCGCFGGSPAGAGEDDDAVESGDGKVIYDPANDAIAGISGKELAGKVTLELRYLQERRLNDAAVPTHSDAYQQHLQSGLLDPQGKSPLASAQSKQALSSAYKKAEVVLVADPKPLPALSGPLDVHTMFQSSSAALWLAHKKGALNKLPLPPDARSLVSVGPSRGPVADLLQDKLIQPFLPFGQGGLSLLLSFGKLFRVRQETQQLTIAQYLLEAWTPSEAYLLAVRAVWEPCLSWYTTSTLTKREVDDLKGVMGLFLHHALPCLRKHYTVFLHGEGVACFMLLLEMMGWALSWDPDRETPVPLLEGYLHSAASCRMLKDFRPTLETLPESTTKLVEEVIGANEDLLRDMEIQEALPGLEDFAMDNCRRRYNILSDHLDTLFLYQPGGNGPAMTVMWELETALKAHHRLLLKHGFCKPPPESLQLEPSPTLTPAKKPRHQLDLWDSEAHISDAMQQWILAASVDIQAQFERLVAAETWASTKPEGIAQCSIEVQRILNASIEVWMEHTLNGSQHRRHEVGFTITGCLVAVLTSYASMLIHPFTQELSKRGDLGALMKKPQNTTEDPDQPSFLSISRLVRPNLKGVKLPSVSTGPEAPSSIGSFINNGLESIFAWDKSVSAASLKAPTPVSQFGPASQKGHTKNAGTFGSNSSAFTPSRQAGSPARHKTSTLSFFFAADPEIGQSRSTGVKSMTVSKHKGTRSAAEVLAPCADKDALVNVLEAEPGICLTQKLCVIRSTLGMLVEDCAELGRTLRETLEDPDRGQSSETEEGSEEGGDKFEIARSPRSRGDVVSGAWQELNANLEAVASSINTSYSLQYRDSLLNLILSAFGNRQGEEMSVKVLSGLLTAMHDELVCMQSNMGRPSQKATLASVVQCTWRAALSTLNLIALNQAGFRPVKENEADTLREFLVSLQEMYIENGQEAELELAIDAQTRLMSSASASALLQALTASTQDLQDIYQAQCVCLAQAHSADGVMIQLSPQQVALVDILRLLRQRRKVDPLAAIFVAEQLKGADAVVTQIIFGLCSDERLRAEARCCLGNSRLTGHMYITHNCLCFTTMLGSDLRTMTDTTISARISNISSISSEGNDSLVLVTASFEQYTFSHFSSTQERDRLLAMLEHDCTVTSSSRASAAAHVVQAEGSLPLMNGASLGRALPNMHPPADDFASPANGRPAARYQTSGGDGAGANDSTPDRKRGSHHKRSSSAFVVGAASGGMAQRPSRPSSSGITQSGQQGQVAPVMSAPCELVGTLRNKEGLLQLFATHIEFTTTPAGQLLHKFTLEDVELVSQKASYIDGTLLSVQIAGEKAPFLFAGMTDALISSLKQKISDLCCA